MAPTRFLRQTAALSALLGLAVCACATAPVPARLPAPKPWLVSSEKLAPPMLLRQKLRGAYQDKRFEFECVLQVSQGALTIIGLTPFGSRAFVLSQRGTESSFTKFVERELPFDPLHILADVHRVFFRGLTNGPSDGERASVQGGERVTERWSRGVLQERSFERVNPPAHGKIRIRYGGPNMPLVPARVVIENGWYGYTLEIESIVQERLHEPSRP